jgi:hypothetical protein
MHEVQCTTQCTICKECSKSMREMMARTHSIEALVAQS